MPAPATHTFVHLEVSSASVLNTSVNGPINYLIGRVLGADDTIELEDSVEILSGSNGNRFLKLPVGTTPQRPAGAEGILRFNTTETNLDFHDGSDWNQPLTQEAVTYASLNANGDVGTGASQVAAGDHTHDASITIEYVLTDRVQTQITLDRLTGTIQPGSDNAGELYLYAFLSVGPGSAGAGTLQIQEASAPANIEVVAESAFNISNTDTARDVIVTATYTASATDRFRAFFDRTSGFGGMTMVIGVVRLTAEYA